MRYDSKQLEKLCYSFLKFLISLFLISFRLYPSISKYIQELIVYFSCLFTFDMCFAVCKILISRN